MQLTTHEAVDMAVFCLVKTAMEDGISVETSVRILGAAKTLCDIHGLKLGQFFVEEES